MIDRTHFILAAPAAFFIAGLAGCASAPTALGPPAYMEQYESGRYAEAQASASARAKDLPEGPEKDRAMLVAGESAHALGRDSEAEASLKPLLESGNPEIAGRAATTLGLIAQRAGQDAKAVKLFETGSDKLAGDDSARALLYMGDSYRTMTLEPRARESYTLAQSRAKNDEQLKSTIGSRLSKRPDGPSIARGGFALQVGAFSSRQRAQGMADRLRTHTATAGLDEPRIIESTSKGGHVFIVQIGRFGSKPDAERAKVKLGEGAIVAQAAD